jgi:hypothetical protein
VVSLAVIMPPDDVNVAVPSVAVPFLNVTIPPGGNPLGAAAATVAVKVTDWPDVDGLADEATLVVVDA